jgi:hypothetical protein
VESTRFSEVQDNMKKFLEAVSAAIENSNAANGGGILPDFITAVGNAIEQDKVAASSTVGQSDSQIALGSDFESTRATRTGVTSVNFNGASLSNTDLPIAFNISGNLSEGFAGHLKGTSSVKLGNTVVGTLVNYHNDAMLQQTEVSALLSHSFGNVFGEVQFGSFKAEDKKGHRSQFKLGYDATYVTPFVQVSQQSFDNKNHLQSFVGLELTAFDANGFSATCNTLVSHEGKAYVSLDGKLALSEGTSVSTNLDLGGLDSKAGFTVSLEK